MLCDLGHLKPSRRLVRLLRGSPDYRPAYASNLAYPEMVVASQPLPRAA